jgi:hypothetical protein
MTSAMNTQEPGLTSGLLLYGHHSCLLLDRLRDEQLAGRLSAGTVRSASERTFIKAPTTGRPSQ